MTRDRSEAALDSHASWALCIACLREIRVRSGEYQPRNEIERQWAREGSVPSSSLSSLSGVSE